MRRLLPRLFSLGIFFALTSPALAGVKQGDRAAEFVSVVDASGKAVSLKAYKDKVVVITFGASWCEPCKKELPAYEKLAQKYQKRGQHIPNWVLAMASLNRKTLVVCKPCHRAIHSGQNTHSFKEAKHETEE